MSVAPKRAEHSSIERRVIMFVTAPRLVKQAYANIDFSRVNALPRREIAKSEVLIGIRLWERSPGNWTTKDPFGTPPLAESAGVALVSQVWIKYLTQNHSPLPSAL
jgi:hypothetical protein